MSCIVCSCGHNAVDTPGSSLTAVVSENVSCVVIVYLGGGGGGGRNGGGGGRNGTCRERSTVC